MEPPGGTALVEESILEALDFRRAMKKIDQEWGQDWWFQVWGPEEFAEEGVGSRDDWMINGKDQWHGFGKIASGFNMLDPIKATIVTPGPLGFAAIAFIGVILVEPAVMLGDLVEDPREKVTATFARTSYPALSPRDTIRDESGNLWSAVKRTNNPADNTVEFELLIITAKDK